MSMRKRSGLMGLLMAFGMASQSNDDMKRVKEVTEEEKEEIARIRADKNIQKFLKKGMKPFKYTGGIIWAMNQKNADRKAKNNGWL